MTTIDRLKYYDDIYAPYVQKELFDLLANEEYKREDIISLIIQIDKKRREIQFGQFRRLKQEAASKYEWTDPRRADGVPIFARNEENAAKVNHRSHTPFDRSIVTNKKSYLIGEKPEVTASDSFNDWLMDNRFHSLLSEVTDDAVGLGEGFTLLYAPGDGQAHIAKEEAYNCVVLYNPNDGSPAYGLIYTANRSNNITQETGYTVYFYDTTNVTEYNGSAYSLTQGDTIPHLFNGVPLIEWRNNSERISDCEPVLNLMDYYDIMDSDFLSELSQLRLAYFLMKNMGLATQAIQEDESIDSLLERMKRTGVITAEGEDADASFISKEINYEAVQYAKQSLKERIYQQANSYDPVSIQGSEANVTAFQIRMKLWPLEQSTVETEIHFTQAFLYMYDLLKEFYSDFGTGMGEDEVEITFKRNIPSNIMQDMIDARNNGFLMSQEQIAKRLPFPIDQEENEKQLAEEERRMLIDADNISTTESESI
jgi:SPP1 family phage portal protein